MDTTDELRHEYQRCLEPLLARAAGYARSIVRDRDDAEDVVQDAALKGYRSLAQYDPARSFAGWWFSIVRNCCRDLLRRRRSRPAEISADAVDRPAHELADTQPERLYEALDRLSPAHREILRLRYFAECSYRQIADALDIPQGTVMSRLHAAREALAAHYRQLTESLP